MPTAISILQRLHQHRAWANRHLLESAASLTAEQLHETFEIGQGSVWKSLVHMYAAEYVWLETLLGDDDPLCPGDVRGKLPGNQLGDGGIESFSDLQEKWGELEARWGEYLAALADESLDEPVHRACTAVSGKERFSARRSDVLLHVALHAHYTLPQAINMLRQLGVQALPDRMLTQLIWQERTVTE